MIRYANILRVMCCCLLSLPGKPPFGAHPHYGLVAVTYILRGAFDDQDNLGPSGVLGERHVNEAGSICTILFYQVDAYILYGGVDSDADIDVTCNADVDAATATASTATDNYFDTDTDTVTDTVSALLRHGLCRARHLPLGAVRVRGRERGHADHRAHPAGKARPPAGRLQGRARPDAADGPRRWVMLLAFGCLA
jgi:hypothetical protein